MSGRNKKFLSPFHFLFLFPSLVGVKKSLKKKGKKGLTWNIFLLKYFDKISNHLVVEACAMIFPPIGLTWGPANMADPSTCETT